MRIEWVLNIIGVILLTFNLLVFPDIIGLLSSGMALAFFISSLVIQLNNYTFQQ